MLQVPLSRSGFPQYETAAQGSLTALEKCPDFLAGLHFHARSDGSGVEHVPIICGNTHRLTGQDGLFVLRPYQEDGLRDKAGRGADNYAALTCDAPARSDVVGVRLHGGMLVARGVDGSVELLNSLMSGT